MKKWLPWIITGIFVLELVMALVPRAEKGLQTKAFGRLPVLLNGRVQPMDSVARNSLLQIRGTQKVPLEGNLANGTAWGEFTDSPSKPAGKMEERQWYQFTRHPKKLTASQWFLEATMTPEKADTRYIFLVHHPELLSELSLAGKGIENSGLLYFSFNELKPQLAKIEKEAQRIGNLDQETRSAFEKQVMKLQNALVIYQRIKTSLQPPGTTDFAAEYADFRASVTPGVAAVRAREAKQDYDKAAFDKLLGYLERYDIAGRFAYPLVIPPAHPEVARDHWISVGTALMEAVKSGEFNPALNYFAGICSAYSKGDTNTFNQLVGQYSASLNTTLQKEVRKGRNEFFYNNLLPFYRSLLMYLMAFLLGCSFWFNWSPWTRKTACWLTIVAFALHTSGLIFRMVLEGRPPVTNLYSSAIFIGWAAVLLGLILERFYKDGIGIVTAGAVGVITQIIAHNLALGGDTMEMLRAVLDTNFWLATHVVCITLGYATTFVAGFLAMVYVLRGVFTRTLTAVTAKSLTRMVYGTICFATFFSFIGTVLGGIWADQSWGRFWGWDVKENGALIIVIWNALILHARWGGLVRERGLMNLAVFGNVVTSFSWFGVNMLGIGLHSYGFMDAAFKWLIFFIVSQVLIIGLGLLPLSNWLSFRNRPPQPPGPGKPGPQAGPKPGGPTAKNALAAG